MRIIFAGTPDISAAVLQTLINCKYNIVACLTQPDRPKGRGRKLAASPVKEVASQNAIHILQPKTLKESTIQEQLKLLQPDLIIVLAYGLILPEKVLAIPTQGCINIHASLLPRWRGAAPIQHAILAGDQETGITMMQMDAGLDTGNIIKYFPCKITTKETSASLYGKLTKLAQASIIETLEQNKFAGMPQDENLATYAGKINKTDALIDWSRDIDTIERSIRAYNPWPIAYTHLAGEPLRIWSAKIITYTLDQASKSSPGTIVKCDKEGIHVASRDGVLALLELQLPGKKVLPAADFINSQTITVGTVLT